MSRTPLHQRFALLGLCCLLGLAPACSSDEPGGAPEDDDQADDDADDDQSDDDRADDDVGEADAKVESRPDAGGSGRADAGRVDAGPSGRMDASQVDAAPPAAEDASAGPAPSDAAAPTDLPKFSFFVTSLRAMIELSGSQHGFGGDLRFGETGENAGLRGADKICATIAEKSMKGAGAKGWRAFLSATKGGPNGGPVHAIDRIGNGPWYDRVGRLVSNNRMDILMTRPGGADPAIKDDLPNEDGVPNHNPDGTGQVDNHDILTGTNDRGELYRNDPRVTCNDWTKSEADRNDAPRVGHSWPRSTGRPGGGGGGRPFPGSDGGVFGGIMGENWMSALDEAGCGPGVFLVEMGPPMESNPTVGSGGGYGGIYCFALMP